MEKFEKFSKLGKKFFQNFPHSLKKTRTHQNTKTHICALKKHLDPISMENLLVSQREKKSKSFE